MREFSFNPHLSLIGFLIGLAFFPLYTKAENVPNTPKESLNVEDEDVEFSAGFLNMGGNGSNIDVARFQQKKQRITWRIPRCCLGKWQRKRRNDIAFS